MGLYVLSISWVFFYDPSAPQQLAACLSLLMQNALIFSLYLAIESRIKNTSARFILAGLLAIYAVVCLADLLLLMLLSTPLIHVISILLSTGSPLAALTEVELSLTHALMAGAILFAAFVGGGLLHRCLPRFAMIARTRRVFRIAFALLAVFYVGEQAVARYQSAYLSRSSVLPLYARLFSANTGSSYTIRMSPPLSNDERRRALDAIEPLDSPPHVLYILLESFRAELVDETLTPNLYRLSREGINYTQANTEAILTALSWNVILMDRPGFMYPFDLGRAEYEDLASWPLEILHRAGYRIVVSSSTDMVANDYDRRLMGSGDTVDDFYMAFDLSETMRNVWDDLATEKIVGWIEEIDAEQPNFMLYQLDATHWDYYFDDEFAVVRPYSEIVRPLQLKSQETLDLVYARYQNAAHEVDAKIGRVIKALKAKGLYDHTAIIVVSDHGEGFRVGKVGHSVLQHHTRSIPLIMRLPGIPGQDCSTIVSPRNIYPTLFDYLGLNSIPSHLMLGVSALPPTSGTGSSLTTHGTGKQADLVLDEFIIHFSVQIDENDITFEPIRIQDHEDAPLEPMESFLNKVNWREALDRLVPSGGTP